MIFTLVMFLISSTLIFFLSTKNIAVIPDLRPDLPKVRTNFGKNSILDLSVLKLGMKLMKPLKIATNINLRKSLKIIYYSLT
jgi:hypothetical protein